MWRENTWTNKSPNSSVVQTLLLQISSFSQNWADKIAKEGTIRHNEVGLRQNQAFYNAENIADTPNVTRAVDFFYNEIKQWDFDNPVFSYATNHFMHMIWKNAKKVGVGCAGSMVRSNNISFFSSSVASSMIIHPCSHHKHWLHLLASQDVLEVKLETERVSGFCWLFWYDPGEWGFLLKTLLMWF